MSPQHWFSRSTLSPKRDAAYQAEREQAQAFERLLALHRVEWWHVNLPMRSRAGFPDYELYGDGWHAWAEIKAVSPATGRRGRLRAEQIVFHDRIRRAGGEVRVFVLPDDFPEANAWLCERTGRQVELW